MAVVRVLIVDQQALFRESLGVALEAQGAFAIVGDAGDAATGARLAADLTPDVIVTDLQLPDARGAAVVTQFLAAQADARIIALTALVDEETVAAAIVAGAQGYILKNQRAAELAQAIRAVAEGGVVFDPLVMPLIWRRFQRLARHDRGDENALLSAFEQDVVALLAAGKNTQQIAATMATSSANIERTIGRICAKLGGRNRAHAVAIALEQGLLQPRPGENRIALTLPQARRQKPAGG